MDDDDDEVWKTRVAPSTVKKKKKRGQGEKSQNPQLFAASVSGCFLLAWGVTTSFLLLRLGFMYTFDTIPETRALYCVGGAATWAKNVASNDVMQAITVWNMINTSVAGLIWRSPEDYTNLGNVLSPAFETMPLLHSVELGFSDRTGMTKVTRRKDASIRGSWAFVQSSSPECYLMGTDGCVAKAAVQGGLRSEAMVDLPLWYKHAAALRLTPNGGVFYWWSKPSLVVEEATDNGPAFVSPAIQLSFKVAFPMRTNGEFMQFPHNPGQFQAHNYRWIVPGSSQSTQIMGRITLKLAALGGDRLVDKRLGDDGSIYLCDATGAIIAARNPGDVLTVEDGVVRFKYIWEVEKKAAEGSVREAFTGSSIKTTEVDEDGTFIAVEVLDPPLARFAIVVVSRTMSSFQSTALIGTAAAAAIVSPTPYLIIIGMAVIFICGQCISTMVKNDGNVGGDASKGRVSIAATMARTTVRHKPKADEDAPRKSKFGFGSLKKGMTFMSRSGR